MSSIELPWVEKYRPKTIDDVVGNRTVLLRLKHIAQQGSMPNMIITGPPGVGKTTAALCISSQILNGLDKENLLKVNASDDRCISLIRTTISLFAKRKVNLGLKIVILDEVDSMTEAAQQGLRRIMDSYFETTRFILVCNISSKIIESLQSRSSIFRFKPLSEEQMYKRLEYVCSTEGIEYTRKGICTAIYTADGDLRVALNNLQSTVFGYNTVSEKSVLKICNVPQPKKVQEIIKSCVAKNLVAACEQISELWKSGYSASDIITSFTRILHGQMCEKMPNFQKLDVMYYLSVTHARIMNGCDTLLQLQGLCAQLCMISQSNANKFNQLM
jgi:replication factor C subunit 2/4